MDIVNFFECKIDDNETQIEIQPFKIQVSPHIIEKLNIFNI